MGIAGKLDNMIQDDSSALKNYEIFPLKNRLNKGERFYKGNYNGQSYFTNVDEVGYKSQEEQTEKDLAFQLYLKYQQQKTMMTCIKPKL